MCMPAFSCRARGKGAGICWEKSVDTAVRSSVTSLKVPDRPAALCVPTAAHCSEPGDSGNARKQCRRIVSVNTHFVPVPVPSSSRRSTHLILPVTCCFPQPHFTNEWTETLVRGSFHSQSLVDRLWKHFDARVHGINHAVPWPSRRAFIRCLVLACTCTRSGCRERGDVLAHSRSRNCKAMFQSEQDTLS